MDTAVQVAIVSGLVAIICAWISRPTIGAHKRLKRIEGEFQNNGGSTTKDQLDRIESVVFDVKDDVAHLRGRFEQHLQERTHP